MGEHQHTDEDTDTDCHCDGDVPHCSDSSQEASYSCAEEEFNNMDDNGSKPWGEVVIFSLIINISTLAGVVVVAAMWLVKKISPNCQTSKPMVRLWVEVLIPMFACGALLATTFFILLPESYAIVMAEFTGGGDPHAGHNHRRFLSGEDGEEEEEEEEPKGEAAGIWRWGSSIMGGFWIPVIMHACFPHDHNHGGNNDAHAHGGADDDDHHHDHDHDPKGINGSDSTTTVCVGHHHDYDQKKGINGSDSTTTGKSALDKSDTTLATTTANNRASSLEEDSTNDLKNLDNDFAYPQEESPLEASVVTTPKKIISCFRNCELHRPWCRTQC